MSVRCRASVQLVRARWLLGGARRGHSACDAVRAARAARRAPRALGQRDAIFCKGIFGCAARGRFYAALFGRQRGNGVRMLGTRARWFWCKWRRTRGCAVCLSTVWPSLARNYVAWCVIRKFDFQPPPRAPRMERRPAPTAWEPLKELSRAIPAVGSPCGSPIRTPAVAGTCPDRAGRAWTPS